MSKVKQTQKNKGEMINAKASFGTIFTADLRRNWSLYMLVLPVLAFYIMFCYKPMYGAIIAFKSFSPGLGILGSPWVGFDNFVYFFKTPDFYRIVRNTLTISLSQLIFAFPMPIILALLFNEIKNQTYKKWAQTLSYLPHFISLVVICGIIRIFVSDGGVVHQIATFFSKSTLGLLSRAELFVPIYVISDIWQTIGWSSIIYLAALSGVNPSLYEAAGIDGAGKWRQVINITLPAISPTIIIMFILRIGSILNVGFEKIILLYNPLIYETSDVISTYVYRTGFESQDWSYSTAVGLFNSVINFVVLICANTLCRKYYETSLW